MESFGLLGVTGAIVFGASVAAVFLFIWIRLNSRATMVSRTLMSEAEGSITFLFDEEVLTDATPRARELLAQKDSKRSDWENFLGLLAARFPHLRSECSELASLGKMTIKPQDNQAGWIEAEYWNGVARITLVQDEVHPDETIDPLTAAAMEHELETLRCIGEDSPQLIWKKDAEGVLIWANRAYIELSEVINPVGSDGILPWPPREIFESTPSPVGAAPVIDMHRIETPDTNEPIWFEVTSLKRGTDTIHFALDATAVVTAREAQRNFVQTLTKTFAQLSVGLAIFDAERRLVLFNPALADLTTLPPNFLISRPTLFSFLDRLRDKQMIPEPKDYSSWRDQMSELETAAAEGSYLETWLLPNGQTFRVNGKPHPNGAIAFLVEDISDEVSLTRKFRSQIDTTAAVLDNLDVAVSVFSPSGSLIMANRAYSGLWGSQPDGSLNGREFQDELALWQSVSAPSPVWLKLEETLRHGRSEAPWSGSVWLDNHVELVCQYALLSDGHHQVTFTISTAEKEEPPQIRQLELQANQ